MAVFLLYYTYRLRIQTRSCHYIDWIKLNKNDYSNHGNVLILKMKRYLSKNK